VRCFAVLTALVACQTPQPRPKPPARAQLLTGLSGVYRIEREGEAIGTEHFTVRSDKGVWTAEGEIELRWPVEQKQGYRLELEELNGDLVFISVWLEIAGARQSLEGTLDKEGWFVGSIETLRGKRKFKVGYGAGTALDFGSPVFNLPPLCLMAKRLSSKDPVAVRTIVVALPDMRPSVVLQEYVLVEESTDGIRKIAVSPPKSASRPTALWVRADGLPTRARTWTSGSEVPFEMILE